MTLVNPADSLERQNEKLLQISRALMRRVEQDPGPSGMAYAQFERSAMLEDQVRLRTSELEHALDLLHESNMQLAAANRETEAAQSNLTDAIETVREGFALFGPDDLMVLCNSRFCRDFADIADALVPGLDFARYTRLISRSRDLALPEGETPEDWVARRMRLHRESHAIFNVALSGDRWLQVSEHRTGNGGTVILQTDVTDIIRIEREERQRLRDTQARMIRATLDHLNQGVGIFDGEARLVGWNGLLGTLLRIPVTDLRLGAGFGQLLDRFDGEIVTDETIGSDTLRRWTARARRRAAFSCEARGSDGRILDVFAQQMPDQGFVISFTDVTSERAAARSLKEVNELLEQRVAERTRELEDALQDARRANASKSRFVAAASHDLLQPLSAAKLFISALSGRGLDPEDAALIEKTETALSSVEEIIDALLDISRLDSGRARFDIAPVRLDEILTALRHQLEPQAAAKGLRLDVVPCGLTVLTDAAYLRRIVQNLASNALRYTARGRVLIGVRRNGGSARIEVWDTGPGIPAADQQAIFEEFHRLNAPASASEGLGLGLAIVKRACVRLDHALDLWSEPGRGSGFFVNLPLSAGTALPVARRAPQRGTALAGADLIVLLVENDDDLRRAVALTLESWGVSVIDADGAEAALLLLEDIQIRPDGLLLDQQLGSGMSGLELLQVLRARYGATEATMVSADRSAEFRRRCERAGVELLAKPIDETKLRAAMERLARSLAAMPG